MGWKRQVARLIERVSGNHVVPPDALHRLHETNHLRRLLSALEVDCVFDVGANRGQYARMLRAEVGYAGLIISYEPLPALCAGLERDAREDPLWHVSPLALDATAGTAEFRVMAGDQFSSLRDPASRQIAAVAGQNTVVGHVAVERATLAGELAGWRQRLDFRRPFLKMDTQGNDAAVVDGAGEAIAAFVGLQSELAFESLYDGSPDFAAALSHYRARGFTLSALVPNNAGHFPRLLEMDCIMIRADLAAALSPWATR